MPRKTRRPSTLRKHPESGRALSRGASLILLGACCLSLVLYLLAHRVAVRQVIAWMVGR